MIYEPALRLHSKFHPQNEADRYIKSFNFDKNIDFFILIEPGLGFLVNSIQSLHPKSTIIALHADAGFRDTAPLNIPSWYPDCKTSLQEFLENEIPENAVVKIIEWRASLDIYGEAYLSLLRETVQFIKRKEAGTRTNAFFGKKWLRNFFRNLTVFQKTILYRTMDIPIVITGSGPSLEKVLPQIKKVHNDVFLLAASSSLPALMSFGIIPDMLITTDGGNWAHLHLHSIFRVGSERPKIFSCAMTAAIPSQCASLGTLVHNDGSLWQTVALNAIGIPSVQIPQRGTVTASAVDLALALSTGSIFLAGMDFAVSGIKSHASPYGFDHLFFGRSFRLNPVYSQVFKRSNALIAGGSYDIYAEWFKNKMASWPKRIFKFDENHCIPKNKINKGNYFKEIPLALSPDERQRLALDAIITALNGKQYGNVKDELSGLLFPSQADVPAARITETLLGITKRYLE